RHDGSPGFDSFRCGGWLPDFPVYYAALKLQALSLMEAGRFFPRMGEGRPAFAVSGFAVPAE
ncbi:MAG: hypothetical protein KHY97_09925, partial [Rothia mucilaginosa]|uniref:hypothetical protein n=1 Tax=Rothia mucilaginosa TaxID=43675 RepID=UPI0026EDB008